jgi:hypothetical protein
MTDAGKKVLAGFARLSDNDRSEVIEKLNEFVRADYVTRSQLRESFEKSANVVAGPVSIGCPCCGR